MRKLESTMCLIRGAELLAGVAARTEPTMRNWLGELAPSTRQMVGTKGNPNNIRQTPHNAGVIGDPVGQWTNYLEIPNS